MNRSTIQSALQVVAVISVLVGTVMTSSAIVVGLGYSRAVAHMDLGTSQGFSIAADKLSLLGVLSASMPLFWGAVLYLVSPRIAGHIHDGHAQPSRGQQTARASADR
jgi:hypothetical protein